MSVDRDQQRSPLRAVIYCRISSDPTGDELGVRRQDRDCRALCERHGYSVVGVYTDDDRSAYSGKPRPAFVSMQEVIADGGADVLVAWHPDRITRQPRELEDLIDLLEKSGTTVRTVQAGEYDLATPAGRMSARIVGAVARGESEHKSARLRRKHLELAENGQLAGAGGGRPFGYQADRISLHAVEADVVRDVARRALAGEALRSIAADLNANGVTTTAGRSWYPSALRRLLISARIAGLRSHRGVVVSDAVWPAIITPAEHRRLVAILTDPARRTQRGAERRLLTGLLVCGRCGTRMVSRPLADRRPSYTCARGPGTTGCGGCKILGDPLDDLIVAAVLERLATPRLAELAAERADGGDALAVLDDVEQRGADLAAMWANGEIDRASWTAARQALDARRVEAQARLGLDSRRAAVVETVEAGIDWNELSHGRRRAVLATLIDTVVIGPAVRGRNWFDADRITVTWRA